jgi:Fe-Mn family superoxide dismutase
MSFTLPELPYPKDALEPHISEETLHYHHDKHHKHYVETLNKLVKNTEFEDMSLEQIIRKTKRGSIFNNAAQDWNHTFYWKSMTPDSKFDEQSDIGRAIIKKYNTLDSFEKEFIEKGKKLFGSGWVWLTIDDDELMIETTNNADQPKHKPLLVCDVWEHAYYLDTQNERGKYIANFFEVANWDFAGKNLDND